MGNFWGSCPGLLEVKLSWNLFSQALSTLCFSICDNILSPKYVFHVLKKCFLSVVSNIKEHSTYLGGISFRMSNTRLLAHLQMSEKQRSQLLRILEFSVLQSVIAGSWWWFWVVLVEALLGAWCLVQPFHHSVLVLVRAVGHAAQLTWAFVKLCFLSIFDKY